MKFEWHDEKEDEVRKRGFDFAFAARIFEGEAIELVDDRHDYGEVRVRAIGEVDGRVLTVVYTDRGDVRHLVTAWPASRQERRKWHSRG